MNSSSKKINRKNNEIEEFLSNQNIILEAVKNLSNRVEAIEEKLNDNFRSRRWESLLPCLRTRDTPLSHPST